MLNAVVNAANALKVASIIVEVLIDLLLANTKSTMIVFVVTLASFVCIVIVSLEFCEAADEPYRWVK